MAPKHHPTPLSGGDRKALAKELTRARAMTRILTERALEKRAAGEALIREADNLACQSWKICDVGAWGKAAVATSQFNDALSLRRNV
jgi:hypothetical protein